MSRRQPLGALIAGKRRRSGLSLREAADRSGGRFSHTTLHAIERGDRADVGDAVVEALADVFDIPVRQVREAAGLPAVAPPFVLPERANRLSMKQRRLVLALVDALLEAREARPR